ncbi:hypothetical protein XA68_13766 [Ophiocordyceps unilateralis]|uniref:Uncharacterized protein n=1 Tax=Ophiocordyceps unilateralis TaxID=268505 RepID=A0A2A9PBI2_OPHUN|nr:hypothetical protein XA68_13766 [Ophiocordyceps unilateralis]
MKNTACLLFALAGLAAAAPPQHKPTSTNPWSAQHGPSTNKSSVAPVVSPSTRPDLKKLAAAEGPAGKTSVAEGPAGKSSVAEGPAGKSSVAERPAGKSSVAEGPAGKSSIAEGPAGNSSVAKGSGRKYEVMMKFKNCGKNDNRNAEDVVKDKTCEVEAVYRRADPNSKAKGETADTISPASSASPGAHGSSEDITGSSSPPPVSGDSGDMSKPKKSSSSAKEKLNSVQGEKKIKQAEKGPKTFPGSKPESGA